MNRHARRKVAKLNKALSKINATSAVRKPVNGGQSPERPACGHSKDCA